MGIPPENAWLVEMAKFAPDIKLVDISQGVAKMNDDPHIWLSPRLVKTQARTIAQALIEIDLDHKGDYQANLDAFLAELDTLDADIQRIMTANDATGKAFIVTHPAWGYFARDYGLEMLTIPENASEVQLQDAAFTADEKGIDIIFYQRGFDEDSPQKLAFLIKGRPMPLEPLNPSWEPNLRSVSMMLAKSVK